MLQMDDDWMPGIAGVYRLVIRCRVPTPIDRVWVGNPVMCSVGAVAFASSEHNWWRAGQPSGSYLTGVVAAWPCTPSHNLLVVGCHTRC